MLNHLWLIPAFPLAGFLLNGLLGKRLGKGFVSFVGPGSSALSAIAGTIAVFQYHAASPHGERYVDFVYNWISSGGVGADLAFQLDPLSIVMLMVVTWIGTLIHIYSVGYMEHEEGYWRYFAYLNLFLAEMLVLVLGSSYLLMFVGWEGVGLCSYLLIGFYYDKEFAATAGRKAFVVNRIGDFGFLIAMFLMFAYFGTVDFAKVSQIATGGGIAPWLLTAICLLLFLGACGKSAQIPLYVWLPDAMAGPTPVSALIHAATMVTAGVYMVVRSNVLFRLSPDAMAVVATIGAVTALFAATIGVAQYDIKKVLAYSTVSQLGYMFLAAGVGAFASAIFHVMTHAFFKACLFLGAGSVIHGCGGEQDMRKMGGLRKYMPKTRMTMLVACIAIAGFPPLAGFFSKDEILSTAYVHHGFLYFLGMVAATFTSFYMFRLYFMTFSGDYRAAEVVGHPESEPQHAGHVVIPAQPHLDQGDAHSDKAHGHHADAHEPHESPKSMTVVLWTLAIGAVVAGFVGLPEMFGGAHPTWFQRWLAPGFLPLGH